LAVAVHSCPCEPSQQAVRADPSETTVLVRGPQQTPEPRSEDLGPGGARETREHDRHLTFLLSGRDYFHFCPRTSISMAAGATLSTFTRRFRFPLPHAMISAVARRFWFLSPRGVISLHFVRRRGSSRSQARPLPPPPEGVGFRCRRARSHIPLSEDAGAFLRISRSRLPLSEDAGRFGRRRGLAGPCPKTRAFLAAGTHRFAPDRSRDRRTSHTSTGRGRSRFLVLRLHCGPGSADRVPDAGMRPLIISVRRRMTPTARAPKRFSPGTWPEGSVHYRVLPSPHCPRTPRFRPDGGPGTAADPGRPEKQPGCVARQTLRVSEEACLAGSSEDVPYGSGPAEADPVPLPLPEGAGMPRWSSSA
jgi:hypothetical protein